MPTTRPFIWQGKSQRPMSRSLTSTPISWMASTLSLIRGMFEDAHQRTVAIGIWIASFSAGAAIGPLVGALVTLLINEKRYAV